MILTNVVIRKQKCRRRNIEKLSKLLNTDQIKVNGNVVIKCNIECDIMDIRQKIQSIFNCSYSQINCKFKEA